MLLIVVGFVVLVMAAPLLPEPDGVLVTIAVFEPVSDHAEASVVAGTSVPVIPGEEAAVGVPAAELLVVLAGLTVAGAWPRVFGLINEGE